ncbi:helix-turn-helix transcriptional regulator [Sutcliffiella cohnii]|uniref:helix-turn-helix domain-containing protein n=1 Tax=Sutcliffiella cohnii TaxID=33932 RepID=UPI002E1AC472|nr:helix-turn-helix transcriptional regulator [Sutcliffiella cohnii]
MKVELRVKEALEERGMTQKALADITGIRPAAISQLVRSYIERLNLDHIERIANALEIKDINELITLKEENHQDN